MNLNPYEPPTLTERAPGDDRNASGESRRGPAWYIAFGGLGGAAISAPLISLPNDVGTVVSLAMILIGCVLGGLAYRVRSRIWPHDPKVRNRQIGYSMTAIALAPVPLFLLTGSTASWLEVMGIGVIVGVAVACGIFASGTRRFCLSQNQE